MLIPGDPHGPAHRRPVPGCRQSRFLARRTRVHRGRCAAAGGACTVGGGRCSDHWPGGSVRCSWADDRSVTCSGASRRSSSALVAAIGSKSSAKWAAIVRVALGAFRRAQFQARAVPGDRRCRGGGLASCLGLAGRPGVEVDGDVHLAARHRSHLGSPRKLGGSRPSAGFRGNGWSPGWLRRRAGRHPAVHHEPVIDAPATLGAVARHHGRESLPELGRTASVRHDH